MIELVKSSVVFSEENHTYFLGEKQLKGITGMISRQLFPNKYKDIPEYILKRATALKIPLKIIRIIAMRTLLLPTFSSLL